MPASKKTANRRAVAMLRAHWHMIALGIGVVIVIYSVWPKSGKADAVVFNPEECLGGWHNAHLAQGAPEVQGENPDLYTDQNSAILEELAIAEFYCGHFKGTVPPGTVPT